VEGTPGAHWIGGWVSPSGGLDAVGRRISYKATQRIAEEDPKSRSPLTG